MKKTYQNPELIVVRLKTSTHLLEQSTVGVGQEFDGTTVLSRKNSSRWDDDVDDDY